ncbi:MAG: hypothetical protein Q7T87_00930 [Polaromonas sp.]|nr:hypothetical protein [Polaromonas sp.]
MQTRATAFLALWNGIARPELQPEYENWHTFEHVPERVGLPGFIEARRYRSMAAGLAPAYFTCYWLADIDALNSRPYAALFAQPTPWTARMRESLTDFFRLPCTLAGSWGAASASRLAALHFEATAPHADDQVANALSLAVQQGRLVAAQWGRVTQTQAIPIANKPDTPASGAAGFVVMLQSFDAAALQREAQKLVQALSGCAALVSPPAVLELLSQVRQADLTSPPCPSPATGGHPGHEAAEHWQRQAPRPDLFETFQPRPGDKP